MTMELPRYLQLLWGQESPGRRGPKPSLTLHEIGAAAVAIADVEGLDAVSMKSVAAAVGFTTMSLYRYVDSKDELHAVMLDAAFGPADVVYAAGDDWRRRLTTWAARVAEQRLAHPWSVTVAQPSPPLTPNVIGWTEAGLEALADTPLTYQQRLSVMLAIDGWGQNHVRQSAQMGLVGPVDPDGPQGAYLQYVGQLIDPAVFPNLAAAGPAELHEHADDLADDLADDEDFYREEFERGLQLLLDGTAALIARQS